MGHRHHARGVVVGPGGHACLVYDDAFDLTVKFGPAPCLIPYLEFKGAAIYSPDLQQLEAAVVNETYAQAITFKARKAD